MKQLLALLAALTACTAAVRAQGPLLISELLFQPHSGEAEYIELYNNNDHPVDLAAYHIVRWIGDSLGSHYPLPTHTVAPHDYVVLTTGAASVAANYTVRYADKVVECTLPPYPNSGGSAILSTADSTVIDRLDYRPDMHSRLLRNKAGVALERRSFNRPTNDDANWFSASSLSGYGTPGYENSQSTEYLVEEAAFDFSSTLLSPDGDGYQDMLNIGYRLDNADLAARAEVYDATGRMVRRLLNNALLGTHGTLQWDGTDAGGTHVLQGHYVLVITVYDLGGKRQTIRRTIAVIY